MSKPGPPRYAEQLLEDQNVGVAMVGQVCPDFREGRIIHARDVGARRAQATACTTWRCLAKDP
jgi:hypothetical protein